jgi:hypothetical protein
VYYFYQHTYRNHKIKARRGTEGMFGSLANFSAQEKKWWAKETKMARGTKDSLKEK